MNQKDIIRAFAQGAVVGFPDGSPDGNCVCVAWIKCAISRYGLDNVFTSNPVDGGFMIQLKDGSDSFSIADEEIAYATGKNGFRLNKEGDDPALYKLIYDYSCLCFAVMAKKADVLQDEVNDFQEAVTFLNEGLNTFSGDRYLGLRKFSKAISLKSAFSNSGCVGRSAKHAFFTSFNSRDLYGNVDSFSKLKAFALRWSFKTLV